MHGTPVGAPRVKLVEHMPGVPQLDQAVGIVGPALLDRIVVESPVRLGIVFVPAPADNVQAVGQLVTALADFICRAGEDLEPVMPGI